MRIKINGETTTVDAVNLEQLLEAQGLEAATVATALNGDFVAIEDRASTVLRDDDAVEILAPMQGG